MVLMEHRLWLEHFSISHKGIKVDVLVDYKQMHVSIIDHNGSKKNYMFCGRSIKYRKSWTEILEAIQIGMDEGFEKLQERYDKDNVQQPESEIEE